MLFRSGIFAVPVTARSAFSKYKVLPGAGVNFGPIIYGTDKTRSVEITNTGEFAHDYAILANPTPKRKTPTLRGTPPPGSPTPAEDDEAPEADDEPAGDAPQETLQVGNFVLSPAMGTIAPGETARVEIVFSPGGADLFGPGQLTLSFTEDVFLDIQNRDYDDNPEGIPFELGGESCIPSIKDRKSVV